MHKQSFDFIEPTLAIMQSLTHNIYNHSLKFIIFPKCQSNIHNRQVREYGDCFFFPNRGTLNGDTTYFQFHRSFFQKTKYFFESSTTH